MEQIKRRFAFDFGIFIFNSYSISISPNSSPYTNQTLKSDFSITTRQKLKVKLYSKQAMLTL